MAIQINQDNNLGSIATIQLALVWQLAASNPVSFKGGFSWLNVDFLDESAQVKESTNIADAGIEYSYTLAFGVNYLNPDMLTSVQPYIGQNAILQFTDNNGLTRQLGSLQNPLSIKIDTDTGKQYTDVNGLALTATWVDSKPAPIIS